MLGVDRRNSDTLLTLVWPDEHTVDAPHALLLSLWDTGASMAQMSKLTGWQAHTIRATISTVFRKRLGLHIKPHIAPRGIERIYQVSDMAT